MQAQSWIPVSERLPESIADVFILTKEGSGGIGMYGEMDEGTYGWERLDHAINLNITHWMPIILPGQEGPEPSEFTKEMREKYKYAIKNKLCVHISAYVKALNVIDRLGAENKKLVEGQKARIIAGS